MTVKQTLVATGASSGIGFELVRQVTAQTQPWSITLGARSISAATDAIDAHTPHYGAGEETVVKAVQLDLTDLVSVRSFARTVLHRLGSGKLDYLLLGAGTIDSDSSGPGPGGLPYNEQYVVNHLAQHYLVHLLREKLVESGTRIVFVSSGGVRGVDDPKTLDDAVKAHNSDWSGMPLYSYTKFAQLLGAHWWRRRLAGRCVVVAVSPGLIPGTALGRRAGLSDSMPDAKSVPEGAASVYAAFTRDDLPEDPEQIFLTSWGEWWPKDVYAKSLDPALQDKWCPSKEEIDRETGLA